jgi:LysR family transcriptional regulator, regulator for bpeEF and oprC
MSSRFTGQTASALRFVQRAAGIEEFVRVAEAKSFVRAAEGLGLSTSGLAKAVRLLEDRLGVKLLHRTTRKVSLSDDGQAFYLRAKRMLIDFEEAQSALSQGAAEPQGNLRIDVPIALGRLVLLPHIVSFAQRHPKIRLDCRFNDRYVDLVDEGIDVAVRVGELADSSLIAKPLGHFSFGTYASPHYLRQRGKPRHPDDLRQHDLLAFMFPTGRLLPLKFERGEEHISFEPVSARAVFNNGEAMTDAAAMGLGLAQVPDFHAQAAVAAGQLKPVLTGWASKGNPMQLVYASSRHLSAKVRALVAHVSAAMQPQRR